MDIGNFELLDFALGIAIGGMIPLSIYVMQMRRLDSKVHREVTNETAKEYDFSTRSGNQVVRDLDFRTFEIENSEKGGSR